MTPRNDDDTTGDSGAWTTAAEASSDDADPEGRTSTGDSTTSSGDEAMADAEPTPPGDDEAIQTERAGCRIVPTLAPEAAWLLVLASGLRRRRRVDGRARGGCAAQPAAGETAREAGDLQSAARSHQSFSVRDSRDASRLSTSST